MFYFMIGLAGGYSYISYFIGGWIMRNSDFKFSGIDFLEVWQ